MAAHEPSTAFKHFEDEANRFLIRVQGSEEYRFEAKQRMIARAEGFAIREAYLLDRWTLFKRGTMAHYVNGIKRCEELFAQPAVTQPVKVEGENLYHRAEISLNLYARTAQQITQRRLYTVAAVASVAAAVASIAALVLMIFSLACGPRG